jgi:hypothetical protein
MYPLHTGWAVTPSLFNLFFSDQCDHQDHSFASCPCPWSFSRIIVIITIASLLDHHYRAKSLQSLTVGSKVRENRLHRRLSVSKDSNSPLQILYLLKSYSVWTHTAGPWCGCISHFRRTCCSCCDPLRMVYCLNPRHLQLQGMAVRWSICTISVFWLWANTITAGVFIKVGQFCHSTVLWRCSVLMRAGCLHWFCTC